MTICGWCDETMEAGAGAAMAAPVSHGLCRSCLDEKLAALPAPAARPALGAVAALGPIASLAPSAAPVPA